MARGNAGRRRVVVLGATGSVGTQTLDVLAHLRVLRERGVIDADFEVVGLSACANARELQRLGEPWGSPRLALADPGAVADLSHEPAKTCLSGPASAEHLVRELEPDVVVASIVGIAGLPSTLAAAQIGADIAVANKESLVAGGEIVLATAQRTGARLLPLDSEHAAAWVCLKSLAGPAYTPPAAPPPGLRRLILTASGGAFRDRSRDEVYDAKPAEALNHPNWDMGAKVTIDSATLANKALELIEAHWLFGVGSDRLGVLVHRQSIVHALAECDDHGVIAQLAAPDMRLPIQAALTHPAIVDAGDRPTLDLASLGRLDFAEPDFERFPALAMANHVIDEGGTKGAVFSAANEVAVEAFLRGEIPFGRIDELAAEVTLGARSADASTLEAVIEADAL
ncbi:MAG: 1-deoxy-D-xylulose-5-phosphate reductoisomerase, partial [Phycisphaerae bacterium]|nr:1-deoxy-D-xylulose-5-phosphate reductoisomerase [Phycisphaerae bacterium]